MSSQQKIYINKEILVNENPGDFIIFSRYFTLMSRTFEKHVISLECHMDNFESQG